jgi:hypothetical protein
LISIDKKEYIMHPNQRFRVYYDYDPESDLRWWDPHCRRCKGALFNGERRVCSECQAEIDKTMKWLGAVCI